MIFDILSEEPQCGDPLKCLRGAFPTFVKCLTTNLSRSH